MVFEVSIDLATYHLRAKHWTSPATFGRKTPSTKGLVPCGAPTCEHGNGQSEGQEAVLPVAPELEGKILSRTLWQKDHWQGKRPRVWDSPSGRWKQWSVGTKAEPATELLEEMLAGHQRISEGIGDRRDTDLSATSTSTTWRSTHHPLLKEPQINFQDGERLALQRAPVTGGRPSSKPPTVAGHHGENTSGARCKRGLAGLSLFAELCHAPDGTASEGRRSRARS